MFNTSDDSALSLAINNGSSLVASSVIPTDLAGNTLATASDLGIVESIRTVQDFVGATDPDDFYRFQLIAPTNL
ncbi:MAG: hypothetical protein HC835_22015 [Oscillatoriales cyanobacterium RM2_1_1]|nr:hypothetical protein [Oscillatoriales cyanobacterium RM2_1_1]